MTPVYEKKQERLLALVKKSWAEFKTDYSEKKSKYYSNAKNPEGFIVCWKEDDIVLQLSSYFYKNLKKENDLKDEGIEFHSQTNISTKKFEEYVFNKNGNLTALKDDLHRIPKPDFIITKEDDTNALWLVGEVKYFREWRALFRDKITKKDRVDKDFDELAQLKALGICKYTVYLIADAYFHKEEPIKWIDFKKKLPEETKKGNIDYLDLVIMCDKRNCQEERNFKFRLG